MAEEPGTKTLIHRLRESSKSWHGVKLNQPDWSHSSHSIALNAEIVKNTVFMHWILNAWQEPPDFELPADCGRWSRWIDTRLEPPEGVTWEEERPVLNRSYRAAPHSVVVLSSSIPKKPPCSRLVLGESASSLIAAATAEGILFSSTLTTTGMTWVKLTACLPLVEPVKSCD